MSIEARKYQLIEKVMTFNESQIEQIELFLKQESELEASLSKSMQQVENGDTIPHSEVKKKYEKWL